MVKKLKKIITENPFANNKISDIINEVVPYYFEASEAELKKAKEGITMFNKIARTEGANNIPSYDARTLSDTPKGIVSTYNNHAQKATSPESIEITDLVGKHQSIEEKQKLFSENPEEAMNLILRQGNDLLSRELEAASEEETDQLRPLQRLHENNKKELEDFRTERNKIGDELGRIPHPPSPWKKILYFIFVLIPAFSDLAVSFSTIEEMAKMPLIGSLFLAFSVAASMALTGHFLGKSIKLQDKKGVWSSTISAVLFLIVIFSLSGYFGSWFVGLINLAMFAVITVAAYFFTEDKAPLRKEYHKNTKAIRKKEIELGSLEGTIGKIKLDSKRRIIQIITENQELVEQKVEAYKTRMVEESGKILREIQMLKKRRQYNFQMVDSFYRQAMHQYRSVNEAERKQKNIPLVAFWEEPDSIPPLDIPFEDGFDEPLDIPQLPEGDLPPDNPDTGSNIISLIKNTSIIILMALFIGCQSEAGHVPASTDAYVLFDETDIQLIDTKNATNFVSGTLEADTAEVYDGSISLQVGLLNNRLTNRFWDLNLSSGEGILGVTKERKAEQAAFYHNMYDVFSKTSFQEKLPQSKLYRPICKILQVLADSPAERKVCFIFSDLLENTKYLSFYSFMDKPGTILNERDRIINTLNERCELPDLTGIELYIIHHPNSETDELFDAVLQFWTTYFKEKGANVYFFAGI